MVGAEGCQNPVDKVLLVVDYHLEGHLSVLAVSEVACGKEAKIPTGQEPTGISLCTLRSGK